MAAQDSIKRPFQINLTTGRVRKRTAPGLLLIASLMALGILWVWDASLALNRPFQLPTDLSVLLSLMLLLMPCLSIALAAMLIASALPGDLVEAQYESHLPRRAFWLAALFRWGLALLLILSLAYTIYWLSIWDASSDGVSGLTISLYSCLAGIFTGVILSFVSSGARRTGWLVFSGLVILAVLAAFRLGWGTSYVNLTSSRAGLIQGALESYHARTGRFPDRLDQLVPQDLLALPGPVILYGQGWCYQGGADYFRLGTYFHRYFYTGLKIRIYAATGTPPKADWECQENLSAVEAKYGLPGN